MGRIVRLWLRCAEPAHEPDAPERASRGPWRLKALIDHRGHAVTSRFIVARPRSTAVSLETLWAILNSPLANAYAFSHLGKRDNIVGDIRKIPLPGVTSFESIHRTARVYLDSASSGAEPRRLRELLLDVDCEVLKAYLLPVSLENSLLSIFHGRERVGVPFEQCEYMPDELSGSLRLSDFMEFERDWPTTNRERGELIDKNIAGTLSPEERIRLDALQAYADYHLTQVAPRSTAVLDELEKRLFAGTPVKDGTA